MMIRHLEMEEMASVLSWPSTWRPQVCRLDHLRGDIWGSQ